MPRQQEGGGVMKGRVENLHRGLWKPLEDFKQWN